MATYGNGRRVAIVAVDALFVPRPVVAKARADIEQATGISGSSVMIAATHSPGAYEDVVRLVVPELQRRSVFRDRYTGTTLRDHLGLTRPLTGDRA